jgi:hypothetical protein
MRIAFCTARFMARRKATRRSSCWAMLVGDQLGVQFRLADLDDVQRALRRRERRRADPRSFSMSCALLADHNARTRGVDRDAALFMRALDDDLATAGLLQLLAS